MTETYRFAELNVRTEHRYPFITEHCKDYRVPDSEPADFTVTLTEQDTDRERPLLETGFSDAYLEFIAFHRKFCNLAAAENVLLFHCSSLIVGGRAYAFTAPSGTGKSTHAALWRRLPGDRVTMLNDDKPFLCLKEGQLLLYGSPWTGKHGIGANISAPLAGIAVVHQSPDNRMERVGPHDAIVPLMNQIHRPDNRAGILSMFDMVTKVTNEIPIWDLYCNMDLSAAELSYTTMTGETL